MVEKRYRNPLSRLPWSQYGTFQDLPALEKGDAKSLWMIFGFTLALVGAGLALGLLLTSTADKVDGRSIPQTMMRGGPSQSSALILCCGNNKGCAEPLNVVTPCSDCVRNMQTPGLTGQERGVLDADRGCLGDLGNASKTRPHSQRRRLAVCTPGILLAQLIFMLCVAASSADFSCICPPASYYRRQDHRKGRHACNAHCAAEPRTPTPAC